MKLTLEEIETLQRALVYAQLACPIEEYIGYVDLFYRVLNERKEREKRLVKE